MNSVFESKFIKPLVAMATELKQEHHKWVQTFRFGVLDKGYKVLCRKRGINLKQEGHDGPESLTLVIFPTK